MITAEQQTRIDHLDAVNDGCFKTLNDLKNVTDTELFDKLALKMQENMGERQISLDALVADDSFVERSYLERQLELTLVLKVKAKKVMTKLQSELQSGKQGQRQINVYKSVDSNR